jgi:hypothetical protein
MKADKVFLLALSKGSEVLSCCSRNWIERNVSSWQIALKVALQL